MHHVQRELSETENFWKRKKMETSGKFLENIKDGVKFEY